MRYVSETEVTIVRKMFGVLLLVADAKRGEGVLLSVMSGKGLK